MTSSGRRARACVRDGDETVRADELARAVVDRPRWMIVRLAVAVAASAAVCCAGLDRPLSSAPIYRTVPHRLAPARVRSSPHDSFHSAAGHPGRRHLMEFPAGARMIEDGHLRRPRTHGVGVRKSVRSAVDRRRAGGRQGAPAGTSRFHVSYLFIAWQNHLNAPHEY